MAHDGKLAIQGERVEQAAPCLAAVAGFLLPPP